MVLEQKDTKNTEGHCTLHSGPQGAVHSTLRHRLQQYAHGAVVFPLLLTCDVLPTAAQKRWRGTLAGHCTQWYSLPAPPHLRCSAHAPAEAAEGHCGLEGHDVLHEPLGLAQLHVLDGLGSLACSAKTQREKDKRQGEADCLSDGATAWCIVGRWMGQCALPPSLQARCRQGV